MLHTQRAASAALIGTLFGLAAWSGLAMARAEVPTARMMCVVTDIDGERYLGPCDWYDGPIPQPPPLPKGKP